MEMDERANTKACVWFIDYIVLDLLLRVPGGAARWQQKHYWHPTSHLCECPLINPVPTPSRPNDVRRHRVGPLTDLRSYLHLINSGTQSGRYRDASRWEPARNVWPAHRGYSRVDTPVLSASPPSSEFQPVIKKQLKTLNLKGHGDSQSGHEMNNGCLHLGLNVMTTVTVRPNYKTEEAYFHLNHLPFYSLWATLWKSSWGLTEVHAGCSTWGEKN